MNGVETQVAEESGDLPSARRPVWRRKRWIGPLGLLAILLVALAIAWSMRERIAGNIIEEQLDRFEIPGQYEIERIGGRRQVITDLVLGDPEAPDFTADRVEISLRHRFGAPAIERIVLTRPRLFGKVEDGELSFGSLDELLFRDTGEPPGLPELNLVIRDGRGLLETPWGPVGMKVEGQGRLDDGFKGIVAANAPVLGIGQCEMQGATVYGELASRAGVPSFSGPVRWERATCPDLSLAGLAAEIDAKIDADLAGVDAKATLQSGALSAYDAGSTGLDGTLRLSARDGKIAARHSLALRGVRSRYARGALLTLDGSLRAQGALKNATWRGEVEGNGLRMGPQTIATLSRLARTGSGTLLEPLIRRFASVLRSQARGSAFAADLTARKVNDEWSLVVPEAHMRGGSGTRLLSVSRLEASSPGEGPIRLSGNLGMGGAGLPRLTARMERLSAGETEVRVVMDRYEAGGSALAVPGLTLRQSKDGALRFLGRAVASGAIPGGQVERLQLPLRGNWNPGGVLSAWDRCADIRFDRLSMADLVLDGRRLTLCPPPGRSILRAGADGLRIAAGTPGLDLSGMLGGTPIRLSSGPVGFAYPGVLTARAVDVALGPAATASRFRISEVDARLGGELAGSFADAEVSLDAVPLDILDAQGNWRLADGRLELTDGRLTLTDRERPARFEPLVARDARLALEDNIVTALAQLRHPDTDRIVTAVDIRHDLAKGAGRADLNVPGILFDADLQPDDLSRLALGVVANARGVVEGSGRIDWSDAGVTSSGVLSTDDFDFAAAFGPVRGASGTIRFTDLLNLTTAPDQTLRVASINPGIEVTDGEIRFDLKDWTMLSLSGGRWPFMGGELVLRDVDLNFGVEEERRYIFEIIGLDAGVFVERMELGNLSATGTFDGTVPIIFDAAGNGRIEEGVLISRPPGGNISYVGELTYEDLSAIANFAFDALRSLDYTQMRVIMDGPLTGEIVTRVRFDGVKQGEGASSNFVTRRLANLPLQFRINIKAQFYQLLTSMKSLYDPASVRDPRDIGLLTNDGKRLLRREITGAEIEDEIDPEDVIPDETTIQEQESE